MKKKFIAIFMVCLLMTCLCVPVFADEKPMPTNTSSQTVDVPVVDTEGNVLGTVKMHKSATTYSIAGLTIFYMGVKALVYNGATWVVLHPDLTMQIIDTLTTGVDYLIYRLGELKEAYHNGSAYTKVRTISDQICVSDRKTGNWICKYSV